MRRRTWNECFLFYCTVILCSHVSVHFSRSSESRSSKCSQGTWGALSRKTFVDILLMSSPFSQNIWPSVVFSISRSWAGLKKAFIKTEKIKKSWYLNSPGLWYQKRSPLLSFLNWSTSRHCSVGPVLVPGIVFSNTSAGNSSINST